jgi:hypothetical protein
MKNIYSKIKDPKILIIIGLCIAIIFIIISAKTSVNTITTKYNAQKITADSIYKIDSLAMLTKYSILDSQYVNTLAKKDSLSYHDSINEHSQLIMYKTIYKDSIKIIYVKNDDFISSSQKIIVSLQDSVNLAKKTISEKDSTISKLQKQIKTKKKETKIDKSKEQTVADKKLTIYANLYGNSTQNIKLTYGLEARR